VATGQVAQLVEQGIENPRVGGSIPSLATTALLLLLASGCGDQCQQLCQQSANRLANCKSDALSWADLGARTKNDFVQECRSAWELTSSELTQSDNQIALEACRDAGNTLERLECDEVIALYGPSE
jgi:hypothetical protein